MNIKIRKTLGLVLLVIFTLFSCERNVEEDSFTVIDEGSAPDVTDNENNLPEVTETPDDIISYAENVRPIIDNNCVECHRGQRFPDLRQLSGVQSSIERIGVRINSTSNPMPPSDPLNADLLETINTWIADGFPNN